LTDMAKIKTYAKGTYVKWDNGIRVDLIGQVVEQLPYGKLRVRVPYWCADGWHMDMLADAYDCTRSNKRECQAAAAARGWR